MYLTELDLWIRGAVHAMHSDFLTETAYGFSFIGSAPFLALLFLLACLWLVRVHLAIAARTLAIVMAGEIVLQNGLKMLFARARPEAFYGATADTYSFPSGHALSSFCFFGTLALLARERWKNPAYARAALAAATLLALGIGWSRIYLGVHYPSDVVGGYGIGAAWIGALAAAGQLRFIPTRVTINHQAEL